MVVKNIHQLVLAPRDPDVSVSPATMISPLKNIGLVGEQETENRFLPGDDFLSLICFLGCAPDIELQPNAAGKPYCHIEFPEPTQQSCLYAGLNVKIPRCPQCQTPLTLPPSNSGRCTQGLVCHKCGSALDPSLLSWRKSAVFARTRMIIGNIHESEAVPDDRLLQTLKEVTGVGWLYAYIRS